MREGSARGYLEAIICGFGIYMTTMDGGLGNVVAPHVQRVLSLSQSDRQWLVTAMTFAMGAALMLGGRAADYFGAKATFVAGALGFAVTSAAAGLSVNGLQMISCRVAQGVCGAVLLPACLAIVSSASTEAGPRAKIFAVYGTVMSLGPLLGGVLGGVITQWISWRACFFLNLVVAVPVVVVAMIVMRPRPSSEHTERFNILHALLATAALALMIFGASRVGGGQSIISSTLAAEGKYVVPGAILFAGFIWAERHSRYPLLRLSLLADRTRAFSLVALMVGGGSVLAVAMQLSFYMQNILHYTPVATGVALLPNSIGVAVGNPMTGFLVPRIGAKKTFALGALLSSVGLLTLLGLTAQSSYFLNIFPGIFISGVGLGLTNMPSQNIIMSGVQAKYAGIVGAITMATSQVAMALTVTMINTITVASTASGNGEIGGYRIGIAVAGAGSLAGAVLVAIFVRAADVRPLTKQCS